MVAGLVGQALDDVVSQHFSGADSYASSAIGGAAGGFMLGVTGSPTLAGATAGAVTEGSKSLMRGESLRTAGAKALVGAGIGAVGGRWGGAGCQR